MVVEETSATGGKVRLLPGGWQLGEVEVTYGTLRGGWWCGGHDGPVISVGDVSCQRDAPTEVISG